MLSGLLYDDLIDILLFPESEKNPPIREQLYLFMKRFKTQPSEFYALDREDRLWIYEREYDLVKKEAEEADKAKKETEKLSNNK